MATFGTMNTSAAGNHNPNKSAEVAQPPSDSVSSLCFSPDSNFLVATSWDSQVRCWEVSKSGNNISTAPKTAAAHEQPVLCSAWSSDGAAVFSGGCDKTVKMWNLSTGAQPVQVGSHDAPVKHLAWIPQMNVLVSGSWDKTLKYWDLRQQKPAHVQQLPDRCYALSVNQSLMVVGTADRNVLVYNLQNPQVEFKKITSQLKHQTRSVAAFPDQNGFLIGSVEGRVSVHTFDNDNKTFTFKCHRDGNKIYSVNSLDFHPVHGTFATAGSNGSFTFWDKESKQRLREFAKSNQAITCAAFSGNGSIYAYSVCYDWSQGAENYNPATAKTHILLHPVQDADIKPKPGQVRR